MTSGHAAQGGRRLNRLAEGIRELCSRHLLEEKWLLVPSYRVAFQWLDVVAFSGQPVFNLRLKTVPSLALEIAAPKMVAEGLSFLEGFKLQLLIEEVLRGLGGAGGYLLGMQESSGLAQAVRRFLLDLRLAGLAPEGLRTRDFEVAAKGRELAALLRAFQHELERRGLADYPEVLRLAEEALRDHPETVPEGVIIAVPEDMEGRSWGRERAFLLALLQRRSFLLPADHPEGEREVESDASLLRHAQRPSMAPSPRGDGTVELFRAAGEVNEVREVFRRCLERGIPFDEVEILYTDSETYLPLIYEISCLLAREAGETPPATFAEGIPLGYTRPGRALAGWLQWIREDHSQPVLARLLQDGLLDVDGAEEEGFSFSRLAALFRTLPIGNGRRRYLQAFDAALRDSTAGEGTGEDGSGGDSARKAKIRGLRLLMRLCCDLLDSLPDDLEDAAGVLSAVQYLLTSKIRSIGEMDEYARKRLLKKVREASSCLGEVPFSGRRVLSWMEEQVATAVVEGEGPRPGRIFVAPLHSGGHSGRTYVFVVGLDDGRFPGAAFQDPLLLDSERKRLSAELPTSSTLTEIKMESFTMLMSRLRASVTLSYSCRDLAEDREMFPSPIMVSAFRITSGKRDATLEDLLAYLPPPASFAPASERGCLSMSEWWLYRLCERGPVPDAEQAVAATFPHLGRGMDAMRARESDGFTVYDGYVPEAGRDLDPTRPGGPVLSSQRLELLGRCPLEYFFTYILGISPPEEFLYDSQVWLNAMETGGLLHRVFNTFYRRIHELGELPDFQRHWPLLQEILESEIESSRSLKPPPNPQAFAETRARLRLTARIFLREEEANREARMPLYFEVAVGTEKEGGNPVDLAEPVTVTLPGGRQVRVRGTIDRIDALPGDGRERFVICDYKTGSAGSYNERDPFRGGRCVQNYLYLVLARSCLPQRHRDAEVTSFEYYFPGVRGHGERISWEASRLDGGLEILDNLVGMLSLGCFPCSDSHDDMKYSDFKPAFLDVKKSAEQLQAKLANHENDALAPFRRLRMPGEVGS